MWIASIKIKKFMTEYHFEMDQATLTTGLQKLSLYIYIEYFSTMIVNLKLRCGLWEHNLLPGLGVGDSCSKSRYLRERSRGSAYFQGQTGEFPQTRYRSGMAALRVCFCTITILTHVSTVNGHFACTGTLRTYRIPKCVCIWMPIMFIHLKLYIDDSNIQPHPERKKELNYRRIHGKTVAIVFVKDKCSHSCTRNIFV